MTAADVAAFLRALDELDALHPPATFHGDRVRALTRRLRTLLNREAD